MERPAGDEWRDHERVPGQPGRSRHYVQANRNKRAVCLDLGRPEAQEVMRELLVARADVLVTNMRPGVAERLGFGWEEARKLNPGLVYCAISAFGADGPRGGRPGYDILAEALAGFMPPEPRGRRRGAALLADPHQRHRPAAAGLHRDHGGPHRARAQRAGPARRGERARHRGRPQRPLARAHREPARATGSRPSRAPSTAPTAPTTAGSPWRPTPSGWRAASARPWACPACSTPRPGTTAPPASTARTSSSRCSRPASSSHTTAWWDDAMAEAGVPAAPGARARRPLRRRPRARHRAGRGGRGRRAGDG